jgi:hypothetical protein
LIVEPRDQDEQPRLAPLLQLLARTVGRGLGYWQRSTQFPKSTLLALAAGIEKSSARKRARFGQNFFAVNGLNLTSVVGHQSTLNLIVPSRLNLTERIFVKRNQEHVYKARSVFTSEGLALLSQLYHLVMHGGLLKKEFSLAPHCSLRQLPFMKQDAHRASTLRGLAQESRLQDLC